jgi:hypothetical protein
MFQLFTPVAMNATRNGWPPTPKLTVSVTGPKSPVLAYCATTVHVVPSTVYATCNFSCPVAA